MNVFRENRLSTLDLTSSVSLSSFLGCAPRKLRVNNTGLVFISLYFEIQVRKTKINRSLDQVFLSSIDNLVRVHFTVKMVKFLPSLFPDYAKLGD